MTEKFKQALRQRIENIKAAKSKVARIGVIGNQQYDDGTPVAFVASVHEYGAPSKNIPPRPFFRPTIANKKSEWRAAATQLLASGATIEDALEILGSKAAADVSETLSQITEPPLQETTIKARNRKYKSKSSKVSTKPLYDTGLMAASISHDVVDRE